MEFGVGLYNKAKAIFDAMDYPEKWKVDGTGPTDKIHRTILERVRKLIHNPGHGKK